MTDSPPDLPGLLLGLRRDAGLRQVEVARQTGITQARLSRAENGQAFLASDEVATLVQLYGADAERADMLVTMAREAQSSYVDARVVLQTGATANLQRRFAAMERTATEIRAFQPAMVLGVLQTAAYASVVFGTEADDDLVRGRLRRQREMLDDPGRRWLLMQTESSLRWHVRSPTLMIKQIEQMIELSRLPNVELGIIGWESPVEVFPSTAFHVYDRTTAVVGTNDGTAIITERPRLDDYRALFDKLVEAASFGDQARSIMERIATSYRSLADR